MYLLVRLRQAFVVFLELPEELLGSRVLPVARLRELCRDGLVRLVVALQEAGIRLFQVVHKVLLVRAL